MLLRSPLVYNEVRASLLFLSFYTMSSLLQVLDGQSIFNTRGSTTSAQICLKLTFLDLFSTFQGRNLKILTAPVNKAIAIALNNDRHGSNETEWLHAYTQGYLVLLFHKIWDFLCVFVRSLHSTQTIQHHYYSHSCLPVTRKVLSKQSNNYVFIDNATYAAYKRATYLTSFGPHLKPDTPSH